ncbi:MAG: putative diguanylate cyclase, partial [Thermoleophilia bacterium]|nr:putative diguanylate cyclase [Thermoleophilia bacterium]
DGVFPLVFLVAILRGLGQGLELPRQAAIDALVLVLAIGYVGFLVFVEPTLSAHQTMLETFHDMSPLVDLGSLMVLAAIVHARGEQRSTRIQIAMVALAIYGVAGVLGGALRLDDDVVLLGRHAALVAICAAALLPTQPGRRDRDIRDHRERRVVSHDRGSGLVLLGPLSVLAVIIRQNVAHDIRTSTIVVASIACGLVMLRLSLAARASRAAALGLETELATQERLAITDVLTGVGNRRYFEEVLRVEGARAARHGRTLGLLVFDLDRFKSINDQHGHGIGDDALRMVGAVLRATLRDNDVVARFGGEEFVALLPETDEAGAAIVAERCRAAIEASPVALPDGSLLTVTTSIGVACSPTHADSVEELVHFADQALYVAKRGGRNRVQVGLDDATREDPVRVRASRGVVAALERLAAAVETAVDMPGESVTAADIAAAVAVRVGLDDDAVELCRSTTRLVGLNRATRGDIPGEGWRSMPALLLDTVGEAPEISLLLAEVARADDVRIEARLVRHCLAWRWLATQLGVAEAELDHPDRCEALVARITVLVTGGEVAGLSVAA